MNMEKRDSFDIRLIIIIYSLEIFGRNILTFLLI